jgi:hypothetical protein
MNVLSIPICGVRNAGVGGEFLIVHTFVWWQGDFPALIFVTGAVFQLAF